MGRIKAQISYKISDFGEYGVIPFVLNFLLSAFNIPALPNYTALRLELPYYSVHKTYLSSSLAQFFNMQWLKTGKCLMPSYLILHSHQRFKLSLKLCRIGYKRLFFINVNLHHFKTA